MSRRPRRVSADASRDDVDPGYEMGHVMHAVERVEAVAHAAVDALENMPPSANLDPERRRAVGRIWALVEAAADAAAAALDRTERAHRRLDEAGRRGLR